MTNSTLDELDAALASAANLSKQITTLVSRFTDTTRDVQDWKNRAFHDSTAQPKTTLQARQISKGTLVDVSLIRNFPNQFLAAFHTWLDELHKVRDIYSRLEPRDQERAHQLHPELLQDATLLGAIRE